jgi:hypothetical protein
MDWPEPYTMRVVKNEFVEKWEGKEITDIVMKEYLDGKQTNDPKIVGIVAGEAVDLIHDIPSAEDVVKRIVKEAEDSFVVQEKKEDPRIEQILEFWFDNNSWKTNGRLWFEGGPELDEKMRKLFGKVHQEAMEGKLTEWTNTTVIFMFMILI